MTQTFENAWYVGDKVRKLSGVKFNGIIVAIFRNLKGETRIVVESEVIEGLLHIYPPELFEKKI